MFRALGANADVVATDISINLPSSPVAGEFLVALVATAGVPTLTKPDGWDLRVLTPTSTTRQLGIYTRIAGASEPVGYTWVRGTSGQGSGFISAYTGVDPSNPVDVILGQGNASSVNCVAPSVDPNGSPRMLLGCFMASGGSGLASDPPGMTLRRNAALSLRTILYDERLTADTPTGTRTAVLSIASANVGILLALNPTPIALSASVSGSGLALPLRIQEEHPMVSSASGMGVFAGRGVQLSPRIIGLIDGIGMLAANAIVSRRTFPTLTTETRPDLVTLTTAERG